MNKLPKAKRDQLILVGMGTLILLAMIIYGLILPQYDVISKIKEDTNTARNDLKSKQDTIKTADTVSNQLVDASDTLAQAEGDMVTGDPALWIYEKIRDSLQATQGHRRRHGLLPRLGQIHSRF